MSFPSPVVAGYHSGLNGSSILHPFSPRFNKEKTKYTCATYTSLLSLERRLGIPEVSLMPCVGEEWRMLAAQTSGPLSAQVRLVRECVLLDRPADGGTQGCSQFMG